MNVCVKYLYAKQKKCDLDVEEIMMITPDNIIKQSGFHSNNEVKIKKLRFAYQYKNNNCLIYKYEE